MDIEILRRRHVDHFLYHLLIINHHTINLQILLDNNTEEKRWTKIITIVNKTNLQIRSMAYPTNLSLQPSTNNAMGIF